MELQHDQQFHFVDGTAIRSLDGLRDKIETMSYADFYHHVRPENNDFANWMRHVLKDPNLADKLEKVDSIVETVEILNDYLHPGAAREHLAAQDDMQSKIERDLDIDFEAPQPSAELPEEQPPELPEMPKKTVVNEPAEKAPLPKQKRPEQPEQSQHLRREQPEKEELAAFHHDIGKLIVKDFVMGLIFGLIIGFVLARMITIL